MFALTFAPDQLPLLAPEGASVEETWVVCFGRRPQVAASGVPALGGIDGWHPMVPCRSQEDAEAFAQRFADATYDEPPYIYDWMPVHDGDDNPTDVLELFVVLPDGTEHQTDVAIAPLKALADA